MGVSIKDIAKYVGVSHSTVSRVLNNRVMNVKISDATRKLIFDAAKTLDYSKDMNAMRFREQKSYLLAIVAPTSPASGLYLFEDLNFLSMMQGIEEGILDLKYEMLLSFRRKGDMDDGKTLRLLKSKTVDGVLIWGATLSDSYLQELVGLPVVLVNTSYPDERLSSVVNDNYGGMGALADHLVAKGHRKFLFIDMNWGISIEEERRAGFLDALQRHGISMPEENLIKCVRTSKGTQNGAFQLVDSILAKGRLRFDALVCANDTIAEGALAAARKHGFRVPEDFAITGADGASKEPSLITTVRLNHVEMGRTAIQCLVDLVEGKAAAPFHKRIKSEFVARESA